MKINSFWITNMATILQIIKIDRNLSLFTQGIKEAQLENKLNENGPFTVLGPINLAFRKLLSFTYEQLLEPANREKLLDLLSGYIFPGKKMIHEFRHDQKLVMLNGKEVVIKVNNGRTYLNGAKILAHNMQGSNGVIHLLDNMYDSSE